MGFPRYQFFSNPPDAGPADWLAEVRALRASLPLAEADTTLDWHEVLNLWLAWNEAQEAVTSRLYDNRHSPDALASILDELDELRRQAVAQSQALVDKQAG